MERYIETPQQFTSEALTVEDVMKLVADSRQQLRKDINFMNMAKFGGQLTYDDCQEILATVTLNALEAAGTYNPSRGGMRTWLSNIAHNEMVNLLRQKNFFSRNGVQYMDESDEDGMFDDGIRQMHYRLDEDESRSTGVFGKEATREALLRLELVADAISSLSKKDQSVIFMLREGLSGKEIADALGVKETAQRKHAFDMRGRLRKRLDERHYAAIQEHSDKYLKSTVRLENLVEQEYQFEASRSEMDGLLPFLYLPLRMTHDVYPI